MSLPVVTVVSGGIAVVDVTATAPKLGLPVIEATNGRGIAVTKVTTFGLPVTFEASGGGGDFGPELVVNGTFDDATGWGLTSGAAISGGVLILDDDGNGLCMAETTAAETITPGDYVWSLDMGGAAPNNDIYVFIGGASERVSATGGALGHYEGMITTTVADQLILVTGFDNSTSTTIDNLSVKRAL